MSALLNYKLEGQGQTVVLIHGLFGNLDNLGLLSRDLKEDHQVLSIDLRNHGLSFHSDVHNYQVMAEDIISLLDHLDLASVILIGHSMGGKVAMKVTELAPHLVMKQIILDMAPVAYHQRKHDNVFAGLTAVSAANLSSRSEVMTTLAEHIEIDGVRQFLSKSIIKVENTMRWRFNVDSIMNNYLSILDWEPITKSMTPTLFVKGGDSDYLTADHQADVQSQFSNAKAHVIANTGHWLHAEKPVEVLRAIRKFL
ncbi:alpha/beta fold hydrolase [Vibrio cortegadensis]|uniref:alpha/beta fold hydrolase n=1 Tax=Vibrio cortegadensis TaxID=1328770 RepID=UPI00352BFE0B